MSSKNDTREAFYYDKQGQVHARSQSMIRAHQQSRTHATQEADLVRRLEREVNAPTKKNPK
jgi:hypothetical protein